MKFRILAGIGAAVAAAVLWAAPASAHATFPAGSTYANSDQDLLLDVPHERGEEVYNVKVAMRLPTDWQALSCAQKPTWSCSIAGREVTWTKADGAGPSANDETFTFRARTGAPGRVAIPVSQYYAQDPKPVQWNNPDPNGEDPAAFLDVVPAGTSTTVPPPAPDVTTTTTAAGAPATTAPRSTTAPTAAPATTVPGATTTTAPPAESTTTSAVEATETTETTLVPEESTTTTEADDADELATTTASDDDGGGGSGGLIAALLAIVVLVGGGAFAIIRRRNAGTPGA